MIERGRVDAHVICLVGLLTARERTMQRDDQVYERAMRSQ
ncbi:hypothetical protein NK6_1287 [Bradyrhizobium diazoefficiens]|uniref:Uncharacterized protein n=1 Tax=Bradyrhizobium diazoefficiens TaxID=1355477 RepID=A0A0E4BKG4_9BRAD|nr:hypothetical protein NK6_1287 [Bradyrhizobium diazoefficiens]